MKEDSDFLRPASYIIAPSNTPLSSDLAFDSLLQSWFKELCSFTSTRLIDYAGLTFDLHSLLNSPPNLAVCELVILLKYGEVEALSWDSTQSDSFTGTNHSIRDEQAGQQITIAEHWSKNISESFGFTAKALVDEDHEINEEMFSSEISFHNELLMFIPKMYYLDGQDHAPSLQIRPLMRAYLKKIHELLPALSHQEPQFATLGQNRFNPSAFYSALMIGQLPFRTSSL